MCIYSITFFIHSPHRAMRCALALLALCVAARRAACGNAGSTYDGKSEWMVRAVAATTRHQHHHLRLACFPCIWRRFEARDDDVADVIVVFCLSAVLFGDAVATCARVAAAARRCWSTTPLCDRHTPAHTPAPLLSSLRRTQFVCAYAFIREQNQRSHVI